MFSTLTSSRLGKEPLKNIYTMILSYFYIPLNCAPGQPGCASILPPLSAYHTGRWHPSSSGCCGDGYRVLLVYTGDEDTIPGCCGRLSTWYGRSIGNDNGCWSAGAGEQRRLAIAAEGCSRHRLICGCTHDVIRVIHACSMISTWRPCIKCFSNSPLHSMSQPTPRNTPLQDKLFGVFPTCK